MPWIAFVDPKQHALAFLLQVREPFEIGDTRHLVRPRQQFRQVFRDQVVVLHGCQWQIDAGHPADATRPETAGVDHVSGNDSAVLGRHYPLAIGARGEGDHAIAQDHVRTTLTSGDRKRVRRPVRIDGTLVRIEEAPEQAVGGHDRALGNDFVRCRESRFDSQRLVDGKFSLQPFPARGRGRDAVTARHVHADTLAALRLDLPVQVDRVCLQRGNVRVVIDGVKPRRGVPG